MNALLPLLARRVATGVLMILVAIALTYVLPHAQANDAPGGVQIEHVPCAEDEVLAPAFHGYEPDGTSTYECVHIDELALNVELATSTTSTCPKVVGTEWRRVPKRMRGVRVDLVAGGTKVVRKCTLWNPGDTTYFVWPNGNGVGTS